MQTENLKCFFVRYVITCHLTTDRASLNRFFAISLHDYLHYCGIFLARFQISGSMSLTQSLFFTMQTGIFKLNNFQLAGAKRSFPSEAAYYLLYADLGILRANIAYQSNTMSHEAKKLPRSQTKSSIVHFNQTFIQRQHRANQARKINRHTQQILNLATQIAVKELLKSKCLTDPGPC